MTAISVLLKAANLTDLLHAAGSGVSLIYVLKKAGYSNLSMDELVQLRMHGSIRNTSGVSRTLATPVCPLTIS